MLSEKCRGQSRLGDNVGEPAKADIEVDAGRVQNPSPLPTCSMRLDEKDFTSKLPRGWQILLGLLAAPFEVFELRGKRVRELAIHSGVPDEGVYVLADERTMAHTASPFSAFVAR
jgi:hypothetical protein